MGTRRKMDCLCSVPSEVSSVPTSMQHATALQDMLPDMRGIDALPAG